MSFYSFLIKAADYSRNKRATRLARFYYWAALCIGGPRDRHCQHMMAVCYVTKRRITHANRWFDLALEGASPPEEADIYLDMAKGYEVNHDHVAAEGYLEAAYECLSTDIPDAE